VADSLAMSGAPREEPLEERIAREAPGVRAYLARLLGPGAARGAADDLAQEVVARALACRGAFDSARPLGAWLRGVALRAYCDHVREHARAPAVLDGETVGAHGREITRVDERESVERALGRLSGIERTIVLRFHARGESIREIAGALGMPDGTVKSHLHRARRKLAGGEA
jgi:RNA polymerase sigma-70 factor (ECF subfamily)